MRTPDVDARALARVSARAAAVGCAALALAAIACTAKPDEGGAIVEPTDSGAISVTSDAFAQGERIPDAYTCEGGQDVSPDLAWSNIPDEAVELVLIVDDPDAPGGVFTHWIVYGIDPGQTAVGRNQVPAGAVQGTNSFGTQRWGGPCPPPGDPPHRYRFTVWALREALPLEPGADVRIVREVLAPLAVAEGTLTGTFSRG